MCAQGYSEVWPDDSDGCANSTSIFNGTVEKRCCRYSVKIAKEFPTEEMQYKKLRVQSAQPCRCRADNTLTLCNADFAVCRTMLSYAARTLNTLMYHATIALHCIDDCDGEAGMRWRCRSCQTP
eukprot:8328803-Pyramimonas_sp.AAC.2